MPLFLWPLMSLFAGWVAGDVYNEYQTSQQAAPSTVVSAVKQNWLKWSIMAVVAAIVLYLLIRLLKILKIKTK